MNEEQKVVSFTIEDCYHVCRLLYPDRSEKKKLKLAIFNPLLVSIIFTIIVLVISKVDYKVYNEGAKYLSWFLTPATVCLAIPLYEQWQVFKKKL